MRSRQIATLAERRLRGSRIKRGLGGLHDLDAPQARPRTKQETEESAVARPGKATEESTVHSLVFGADWRAWRRVKADLFRADAAPEERRRALDAIEVWRLRARRHRPFPAYVEATALLMRVVIMDETGAAAARELAQAYGAALSRCVHVMTGSFATGGGGDTYRKRARKLGFPEEAVEVRQRMAHGEVPGITEMRWVCGLLLQFLFHSYWSVQANHIRQMEASAAAASGGEERGGEAAMDPAGDGDTKALASVEDMRALLDELSGGSDEDEDEDDASVPVAGQLAAVRTTPTLSEVEGQDTGVEGSTKIGQWVIS